MFICKKYFLFTYIPIYAIQSTPCQPTSQPLNQAARANDGTKNKDRKEGGETPVTENICQCDCA